MMEAFLGAVRPRHAARSLMIDADHYWESVDLVAAQHGASPLLWPILDQARTVAAERLDGHVVARVAWGDGLGEAGVGGAGAGGGWGGGAPRRGGGAPSHAVQSQPRPPASHSEAATPGHQLGNVRCEPACPGQPDRVVYGRGDGGLEG